MSVLREMAAYYEANGYRQWWDAKTDDEKRGIIESDMEALGASYSPSPPTMLWLLEKAGVAV